MLEVLNGFLLVYFIILCTLSAIIPIIVKPISTCFARPSKEERQILEDIVRLKAEQSSISIKDEFAAYSKLQRKILKFESLLKTNSQSRISRSLAIKGSLHITLQVVTSLLIFVPVIWFRQESIVALHTDLFPLASILQYPSDTPNGISTHVWALITNISIRILIKPLTSRLV